MPRPFRVLLAALPFGVLALPASAVTIGFDSLSSGTVVTNQFPEVTFSSTSGFENVTLTFSGGTSQPMVICTRPTGGSIDCAQETLLTFTDPVSDLSFLGTGIDTSSGPVAHVEVFESFTSSGSVGVPGAASSTTPSLVDLSGFSNVTSIRIHSITDVGGIA